jgi:hypothetical protein
MPDIDVRRVHNLGLSAARSAADKLARTSAGSST